MGAAPSKAKFTCARCGRRGGAKFTRVEVDGRVEYVCSGAVMCRQRRGGAEQRTYQSWRGMLNRCQRASDASWEYYGGRGIRVCDRWAESFAAFVEDMGLRPENRTLDRIDPNGHYEIGNCRWATAGEQRRNQRS